MKVSKAIKDERGASSEYQLLDLELQSLRRILDQLQALQPTAENASHINAVRALALTCRLPLEQFLDKIDRFERSLGVQTSSSYVKRVNRKAQWAVMMSEEVSRLRTHITAKVLSLNLLLTLQNTCVARITVCYWHMLKSRLPVSQRILEQSRTLDNEDLAAHHYTT